ncbi:MAG: NUDIX hydrolase [Tahibacter sp.]
MTLESLAARDDEAIWRPHVTVATIVPRQARFLMVEESVRGELLLNQPAGHLEPHESLIEAARRETLEETGWDVEPDSLVGVHQWENPQSGRQFVRFTFAATPLRQRALQPLDDGIERVLWLSRAELAHAAARLRSPMILASVDAWLAGRRLPLDTLQYLTGLA